MSRQEFLILQCHPNLKTFLKSVIIYENHNNILFYLIIFAHVTLRWCHQLLQQQRITQLQTVIFISLVKLITSNKILFVFRFLQLAPKPASKFPPECTFHHQVENDVLQCRDILLELSGKIADWDD